MRILQSPFNPHVKRIVQLHTHAGQKKYNQFIAEGKHVIRLFIEHNFELDQLYTTHQQVEQAYTLIQMVPNTNEQFITLVTYPVLKKISSTVTPSGLVAVFTIPPDNKKPLLTKSIALVNMQDPGNMGTLIRTAAALNITTIIRINGVNCWSPKVVQASAGYLAVVNIVSMQWETLVTEAHAQNIQLCGMVVRNGKKPQEIQLEKSILVIGNEASGLTKEQQDNCDQLITLPMPGHTESLNAAVAGSIGMYLAYLQSKEC